MRNFRTLLPVLIIGAVSLAFIGVSAALEGEDPPTVDEQTTVPAPEDCATDTAVSETDDTVEEPEGTEADGDDPCDEAPDGTDVEGDDDGTEAPDETSPDETDPDEATSNESTPAEHPENHGAVVSEAAHSCPPGPGHGACVSEVAHSDAGKSNHGKKHDADLDDEQTGGDETADAPAESHGGNGKGNGRGHGHGRG